MPVADSSVPHIGVAKSQIFERKLSYDLTWVSQNTSNLMMSDVTSCIIWWNLMTKLWLLFQFQFIVVIHEMEKAMREGRCVTECRSHLTGKSRCRPHVSMSLLCWPAWTLNHTVSSHQAQEELHRETSWLRTDPPLCLWERCAMGNRCGWAVSSVLSFKEHVRIQNDFIRHILSAS